MSDTPLTPAIARLDKRRRHYRRMTFFSIVAVVTLACAPAMFSGALAFALYGIGLFGAAAMIGNALHARTVHKLARAGD